MITTKKKKKIHTRNRSSGALIRFPTRAPTDRGHEKTAEKSDGIINAFTPVVKVSMGSRPVLPARKVRVPISPFQISGRTVSGLPVALGSNRPDRQYGGDVAKPCRP